MRKKIPNYMRTHRRRWGLTQEELALLLGLRNRTEVSRYELLERKPQLRIALAYFVVFGEQLHQLLPKLYSEVEECVMQQVYQLYQTLDGRTDKVAQRKRALLESVLQRAIHKPHGYPHDKH